MSRSATVESLNERERLVREKAAHNFLYLFIINTVSALTVFVVFLISIESLVSIGLSIFFTIFTYNRIDDDSTFNGGIMNWVLLSFAIITPISSSIGMAFTRREKALTHIAVIRSTFLELYSAHTIWDWEMKRGDSVTGRQKSSTNWLEHADSVSKEIMGVCEALSRMLTLPNSSRARHKITGMGSREATRTHAVGEELNRSICLRFVRLAQLCEVLKKEGLPPNEATRIRQWERILLEQIEALRILKKYRTPQALRSFARLFSILLPPFYAPFYAEMAYSLNSLGAALAFAILTALSLTALFETSAQMEDPFVVQSFLDGVHVKSELVNDFYPHILIFRSACFPGAAENKDGHQSEKGDAAPSSFDAARIFTE